MTVPILAREQALGTINLVTTSESGRNFTTEYLALAQALAARAALAIENARHYRSAQIELAERRRVQDALRESEQRFRIALADSDISVYTQDSELRYTWVYKGSTSEELTHLYGKTDADFLIPEDGANLMAIKRRVLESGVEGRYIVRATAVGRPPGFYDTVFAPLRDASGDIIGVTGAVNDITERKRAQDALAAQQAEISALNTRLQRAMSETHHRVKNNLQVIAALLDMQEMLYRDAVPMSEIVRLRHHVKALSTIHDLLTHQAKNDAEVYDLSVLDAIEQLVPIIQGVVMSRTIEFSVDDLRMPVRQSTALTVLVNELVSNAVKHGQGAIRLAFATQNGRAMLEVTDEGPGFAPDFDPVTAANTGLELILTLAQLDLQGEARFENRAEGGGRVVVEFPIPGLTRTVGEQ
jgi:two-component sensor histidine kinase/PAS domain-containing protein